MLKILYDRSDQKSAEDSLNLPVLTEAYAPDVSFALQFPEIAALRLMNNAQTERSSSMLTPIINRRRCLIIGDSSRRAHEDESMNYVERNRLRTVGTPCDHLAYLLAGDFQVENRWSDEAKKLFTPIPKFHAEMHKWLKGPSEFRARIGQSYGVTQITELHGCCTRDISRYCNSAQEFAQSDDLLLVIIDAPTLTKTEAQYNPEPIRNYSIFYDAIAKFPGWKVIIDLSEHSGKLVGEYLQKEDFHTGRSKVAVITSTSINHNPSLIHIEDISNNILWNLKRIKPLEAYDLRSCISEIGRDCEGPIIPQIYSHFSVAL